jgi:hypothetical protein
MVGAVAVQQGGGAGEDAEGSEDEDSDHGGETFLSELFSGSGLQYRRAIAESLVGGFFKHHGRVVGAVAVQEGSGAGEDAEGGEDEDSDHGGETFLSVGFRLRFQGVSTTFPALKCNFRMPHPPKVCKQNFGVICTTIVRVIL